MDDQLKHLYDYTKFHIGMYTTLMAVIVGVFANDSFHEQYIEFLPFVKITLLFYFMAGACGGLIASSIPYHKSFHIFMRMTLKPWNCKLLRINAKRCTHWEHSLFWLGTSNSVAGVYFVLALQ